MLVLDKVVSGWGGKANKGGGNIAFMEAEDGFDRFLDFHVHNVGELPRGPGTAAGVRQGVARQSRAPRELGRAHLPRRRRRAQVRPLDCRSTPGAWRCCDQDLTLNMARHARKLGVRFGDRVEIVDLAQGRRAGGRRRRLRHDRRRVRRRQGRRRRAGQRQPVLQAHAPLGQRARRRHRRRVPRGRGDARRRVRQLHQLGLRRHQGSLPGRRGRALQRQGREHLQGGAAGHRVGRALQGGRRLVARR